MKQPESTSLVLLHHHLKALRLPTITAECEKLARQAAADNADHLTYLLQGRRAAPQGGALPDPQDPRGLRLRGAPLGQQDAALRAGAL